MTRPVLELRRGITLDRQHWAEPYRPDFESEDIRLIASMGFQSVKLIINPAPHLDFPQKFEGLNAIIMRNRV